MNATTGTTLNGPAAAVPRPGAGGTTAGAAGAAAAGPSGPVTVGDPLVLIVDCEPEHRRLTRRSLEREGCRVMEVPGQHDADRALRERDVDLVVLDVRLPDGDGFDLLERVRERANPVPVIILTQLSGEADRLLGFKLGADDYVVKPFFPRELAARVHAVLRRAARSGPNGMLPERVVFGPAVVMPDSRSAWFGDDAVELTAREWDLLLRLVAVPGVAVSREVLLRDVWASSSEWQSASTVTEHMRRLRKKLEREPSRPAHLHTVRGYGYRFTS